ncbi:MAG TPA: hypothetical protein DCY47_10940 [Candidatus Accumulibacter sp.]|nr:hypothetical protein [Accumulibacter sp.]
MAIIDPTLAENPTIIPPLGSADCADCRCPARPQTSGAACPRRRSVEVLPLAPPGSGIVASSTAEIA